MTTTIKVSGDNLTGAFDSELMSANSSIVAALIDDVPWYKVSSTAATKIIGKSPLGSPATTYFAFAFRKAGNPASSQVFLHPFTSAGATAFRLRLSSTGTIILDGSATNSLDTSAALSNDTTYAIVGSVSATEATVTIYASDGTTVIDTITATNTFGLVDNWRMGQIGTTPQLPDWFFRMLLVGDAPFTAAQALEAPTALGSRRIGIIGDSNTAAMGANGQYYFDALEDVGVDTRDVYFWGVGGKRIAVADLTGKTAANNITDAQTWLGAIDTWVVALGTNDRPQTDAVINADIDTILTAIGTEPRVVWIGLTSKGSASADDIRVNGLIQAKLTARGNAEFADWDAHIRAIDAGDVNSPLWLSTDTTHMSPTGYPYRAAYVASYFEEDDVVNVSGTASATASATATRTLRITRTGTAPATATATATRTFSITRTGEASATALATAQIGAALEREAIAAAGALATATRTLSITRTGTASTAAGGSATTQSTIARTGLATATASATGQSDVEVVIDRDGNATATASASATIQRSIARTGGASVMAGASATIARSIARFGIATAEARAVGVVQGKPFPATLTLTAEISELRLGLTDDTLTMEAAWR